MHQTFAMVTVRERPFLVHTKEVTGAGVRLTLAEVRSRGSKHSSSRGRVLLLCSTTQDVRCPRGETNRVRAAPEAVAVAASRAHRVYIRSSRLRVTPRASTPAPFGTSPIRLLFCVLVALLRNRHPPGSAPRAIQHASRGPGGAGGATPVPRGLSSPLAPPSKWGNGCGDGCGYARCGATWGIFCGWGAPLYMDAPRAVAPRPRPTPHRARLDSAFAAALVPAAAMIGILCGALRRELWMTWIVTRYEDGNLRRQSRSDGGG
jgi:hypothetical protein